MDDVRSLPQHAADDPYAARDPAHGSGGTGLAFYNAVKSGALPQHLEYNVIAPIRTIGIGADTLLKSSFWYATVEEAPGDQRQDRSAPAIAIDECGVAQRAEACARRDRQFGEQLGGGYAGVGGGGGEWSARRVRCWRRRFPARQWSVTHGRIG